MKNQYLEEAIQELVNGHSKKRHPFRYFVLATNENGKLSSIRFLQDENILNQGEEVYVMMCAHCHGLQGGGDGPITKASFSNNPYDVIPAFNNSEDIRVRNNLPMTEFTEGHIFHTITYGYNKMGPHASQITEEERWKIVYYIKEKLQK